MSVLRFFVNPRSGGGAGQRLGLACAALGTVQSLTEAPPRLTDIDTNARWIAIGGDGTVAAVMTSAQGKIPVGVIPVGTGNDLARAYGWPLRVGNGVALARSMDTAPIVNGQRCRVLGPGLDRVMCLYLSVGWDAAVAGRFHAWRTRFPTLFPGSLVNKMWYAVAGLGWPKRYLTGMTIDNEQAPCPPARGCVVYLSIGGYGGGGTPPWPRYIARHVLSHGVAFAWARWRARHWLASADQTRHQFTIRHETPAQIDGEPLRLLPGTYVVSVIGEAPMLAGPTCRHPSYTRQAKAAS